ncbi:MAG: 1-deoxy-D-xylulose-5-phosphate reductoisomerase [Erysipelotrichaceae bacterium]|nr:1-deoxy-D-xylulose-5-phosphate reductoisomerase [Erysipelotrichaceae bacterium]MBR3352469.1 1-deoxy-D-xylulose-5-phosphate reductoisomerase [Erysipelotrichaceae bacterium]
MKKKLVLLGASGSIGSQTVDIVSQHPDLFEITALSVGHNVAFLENYLKNNKPQHVCVADEADCLRLQKEYPQISFFYGAEGLMRLSELQNVDLVVNSLQGFVGLLPTLNALQHGYNVALANKETLVAAGSIVTEAARRNNVKLIPIDSEHSAIFQCLQGSKHSEINKLIITASGGSFRNLSREELGNVTLKQALSHPNWSMGKKITIDSATMMNKGFEVLEARWLFDIDYDHIETILHYESVVHSLVEFRDHSMLAQLGVSDMRVPIQYALAYPDRLVNNTESLDLAKLSELHFRKMDYDRYPLLRLAFDVGRKGGNLAAVMNGANEKAVNLFLNEKISFLDIERLIFQAVDNCCFISDPSVDDIINSDRWAQQYVEGVVNK